MKKLALFCLTVLIALLATVAPAPKSADAATLARYYGTMTTTVRLVNVYGQYAGTYAFRTNVVIYVETPLVYRGLRETNPFNLAIQSYPLRNAYGEASIYSARPYTFLAQYWRYSMLNSTQFSGSLVNNFVPQGLGANLITVPTEIAPGIWMPFSQAMANGTRMSGSINAQQAIINVSGNITSLSNPFSISINARRF